MRDRIRAKEIGTDDFRYGSRYFVGYAGASYGETFTFTRKKIFVMIEAFPDDGQTPSKYKLSRRKLKQLIKEGCIEFIFLDRETSNRQSSIVNEGK